MIGSHYIEPIVDRFVLDRTYRGLTSPYLNAPTPSRRLAVEGLLYTHRPCCYVVPRKPHGDIPNKMVD